MHTPLPPMSESDKPDPAKAPGRANTTANPSSPGPAGRGAAVPDAVQLTERAPCEGCP